MKKKESKLIKEIKDQGLEYTLASAIQDEQKKELLKVVFHQAFDILSDEDYEALVLQICDELEEN
jgi:copper homeostasis protein CutC